LFAAFVAIMFCVRATRSCADLAAELRTEYQVLSAKYAASVPGWRPKAPATGSLLFAAADQYTPSGNEGELYFAARNTYADSLYALARRAAAVGQLSLAYQWATETVRENPDHADARRVLRYEQRDGEWLTAYGAKMFDAGKRWDSQFGWVSQERTRLPPSGRDKSIVRTDHFLVTSTDNQTAAAELAVRLERLYQVWRQLFAGFYVNERRVTELFEGNREPRSQVRPFRVYYHRDRAAYNAALRRRQSRIDETLGIYFDTEREAHFFAGDEQNAGTLFHEAVHQLFQESRPAARQIGRAANFWIIEGVAAYFESLTEHDDADAGLYYTIGEETAGRMPAARARLLDGFYLPLSELTQMGKTDVQEHPEISKLYSQAAGLSAFLMHAENNRYRELLVDYLKAVYSGRDSGQSLAEAAGESLDVLDAAYRRYMESLP
jgi:hypothetical protein